MIDVRKKRCRCAGHRATRPLACPSKVRLQRRAGLPLSSPGQRQHPTLSFSLLAHLSRADSMHCPHPRSASVLCSRAAHATLTFPRSPDRRLLLARRLLSLSLRRRRSRPFRRLLLHVMHKVALPAYVSRLVAGIGEDVLEAALLARAGAAARRCCRQRAGRGARARGGRRRRRARRGERGGETGAASRHGGRVQAPADETARAREEGEGYEMEAVGKQGARARRRVACCSASRAAAAAPTTRPRHASPPRAHSTRHLAATSSPCPATSPQPAAMRLTCCHSVAPRTGGPMAGAPGRRAACT
jgi:hypothetical protein